MPANQGGTRAQLPGQKIAPPDETRFAEMLATGTKPLEEIAQELGWTMEKARRLSRSANLLTAVASINLTRVHGRLVPRAIKVLEDIVSGYIEYFEYEENSCSDQEHEADSYTQKLRTTRVQVRPETRLAAIQTVLKMGGYDKPPEKNPNEKKDLTEMDPEELRREMERLETALADKADPVNAPEGAPDGIEDAEIVSPNSVLD